MYAVDTHGSTRGSDVSLAVASSEVSVGRSSMEEDPVPDELVVALLEDMVRAQMEGIPSFLRTEKMDEQVREGKQAEAVQKAAEIRASYGWLQVPVDFIVGLPLERAEELQEVVKTAWESFWQSLPEVAKSHLDAASAKAEWTKQEARKLVEATLAHAAPFRFRPEVEAMTSLERQLVAATTEAVAGKLGVALQRAVEQDMQFEASGVLAYQGCTEGSCWASRAWVDRGFFVPD